MPWNTFAVQYYNGTSWVTISNLFELQCNVGRRKATDTWSPSSATFTFRYPNGFASPINNLTIGTHIRWFKPETETNEPEWTGVVRDVAVAWGMPYQSNVGNADVLTIYAEGHLAQWGRVQGNNVSLFSTNVVTAYGNVISHFGLRGSNVGTKNITLQATTVDGSALDWLNQMAATANARILDGGFSGATGLPPQIVVSFFPPLADLNLTFSDSATGGTNRKYDVLNFDSIADNYYTEVIVTAPGLANQNETVGSAPYRTLTVDTYANTTELMDDLARLYLAQFDEAVTAVTELSASSEAQTATTDVLWTESFYFLPAYKTTIQFRGTTFYAQIEGASLTATPSGARITYYLSPEELYSWLVLDNSRYGKLDFNKLYLS